MCLAINKTLKSVVDSCFHNKTQLSSQFVSHWLATNCPRLLLPIHRYLIILIVCCLFFVELNVSISGFWYSGTSIIRTPACQTFGLSNWQYCRIIRIIESFGLSNCSVYRIVRVLELFGLLNCSYYWVVRIIELFGLLNCSNYQMVCII